MGVQHKVPIRVAEDVVAEVWRYDDWGGNVDMYFFKDERTEDPQALILPGEWLVGLGKSKYSGEVASWFMDFVGDLVEKKIIPVAVTVRLNSTLIINPLTRVEALQIEDCLEYSKVVLTHSEDWDRTLQLEYYKKGVRVQNWHIPCAWILAIARVAYWEIFGKAFISAAEDAQQKSPERESYAWRRDS